MTAAPAVQFNIPQQRVDLALTEFAEQADLTMVFPDELVRGRDANELIGRYTLQDGVDALLNGTGLKATFSDEVVLSISPDEESVSEGDNMQDKKKAGLWAILAALFTGSAGAQDAAQPGPDEEEDRVDEIIVTGTRLGRADPSARVSVITAEEIKAKGLESLEDVIRDIPQNYSSLNSSTNVNQGGTVDANLGRLGVGVSTANLRGLGSANTLVLLNGRRLSGVPGQEDLFANLRDIPASSIERIEINFDGGSAIYGSDAIAGTINIITKKHYTGAQLSARYESSSTDADLKRINGYIGKSWGSGSISGIVSYVESSPVSSAETGWVTKDYRSDFPDTDPNIADRRLPFVYRSGGVSLTSPFSSSSLILPLGNDGTNTQPGDFIAIDPETDLVDFIERDLSSSTEDTTFMLNIEQDLSDRFHVRGDFLYTEASSDFDKAAVFQGRGITVPETNAFNNFGQDVYVKYFAINEVRSGLIPRPQQTAETEQFQYNLGFNLEITDSLTWVTDYNRSESERSNLQSVFAPNINTDFPGSDELEARLNELLASSDPSIAPNLFGDGSTQNATLAEFYVPFEQTSGESFVKELTSYLAGNLFAAPGGEARFVLGGEWREEGLGGDIQLQGFNVNPGPDPNRELWAAFAEVLIPLVGEGNARPGMQKLMLKLEGRYDDYTIHGAEGQDDNGDPIFSKIGFDNFSPRFGVVWAPTNQVTVRASYAEAFRAPVFSELFSQNGDIVFSLPFPFTFDPLVGGFVVADQIFGANPDLKPETADIVNIGMTYEPEWAPGLYISIDYSEIDFSDRIARASELQGLLPAEEYGSIPEIFERDEDGTLLAFVDRPINISRRLSETLDADIRYKFDTDYGSFESGINYHYVMSNFEQPREDSDNVSLVGKSNGVDRYKVGLQLSWSNESMDARLGINYTPSYDNIFGFDEHITKMDSRTTVDLTGGFTFGNGLIVRAGARNLFDEDFPTGIFGDRPFDATRVDLRGRVAFIELSYDFQNLLN